MESALFCMFTGGMLALGMYLVVSGRLGGGEKGALATAGTPCIAVAMSMVALRLFC